MGAVCSKPQEKRSESTKPSEEVNDERKEKNLKIISNYRVSKVARKLHRLPENVKLGFAE